MLTSCRLRDSVSVRDLRKAKEASRSCSLLLASVTPSLFDRNPKR